MGSEISDEHLETFYSSAGKCDETRLESLMERFPTLGELGRMDAQVNGLLDEVTKILDDESENVEPSDRSKNKDIKNRTRVKTYKTDRIKVPEDSKEKKKRKKKVTNRIYW